MVPHPSCGVGRGGQGLIHEFALGLWSARNRSVFQNKGPDVLFLIWKAEDDWNALLSASEQKCLASDSRIPAAVSWKPLRRGLFKANVDSVLGRMVKEVSGWW